MGAGGWFGAFAEPFGPGWRLACGMRSVIVMVLWELVRKGDALVSEAVGVIVAAIIAGWVAFFSLIISKEQTVSEFRQRWIDELRQDIAALVAHVSGIHGDSIVKREGDQGPLWPNVKTDFARFTELVARIRLRLNPAESREKEGPATQVLLNALKELEFVFSSQEPEFHKIRPLVTTVVTEAQVILKENWQRVRSGETIYQITKWVTLGIAGAALAVAGLHLLKVV